jgi:hypothetical protein
MGAWRWFASVCASFGAVTAAASDGLELSAKSRAFIRGESSIDTSAAVSSLSAPGFAATPAAPSVTSSARASSLPFLGGDPLVENAIREERAHALEHSGCRMSDLCYDVAEGRMTYRGARRYMPVWPGLAPEGVSLKRDRVTFRYSFR